MKARRAVVASPLSVFVTEMKAVFAKRCTATTEAEKHRLEREMRDIMRRHLGAARLRQPCVPRGTHVEAPAVADRKMAAAGREAD